MAEKPNVLFLPKWYPNKFDPFDGNFVENHAHAIKAFANICVLFVHSDDEAEDFVLEEKQNEGITEMRVYFKRSKTGISLIDKLVNAARYAKAQEKGYKYLIGKGYSFDLSHVHVLSRTAFLAIQLLKKHKIPFGITEHWSGYLKERDEYHGLIKKWFTKKAVSKASFISTVSTYLKESMQNHGLNGNYTLIPNVVDEELFQIKERTSKIPQVLFVGNLLQRPKKILDIIQTFIHLHEAGEEFIFHIYGEGIDEPKCRELIQEHQLAHKIILKGTANRAGIAKAMSESSFLVLFSQFENQPCVISEAQSAGIPVVVPDLPGIKEFMNTKLGIVVPTNNQLAFEAACQKMLHTYQDYSKTEIRSFAVNTFGEKVIGKQFHTLYQNAIQA